MVAVWLFNCESKIHMLLRSSETGGDNNVDEDQDEDEDDWDSEPVYPYLNTYFYIGNCKCIRQSIIILYMNH